MPIMKLLDSKNNTVWIPFPHKTFEILDMSDGGGCEIYTSPPAQSVFPIKGKSAREVKRSIQENVDTPIYFLKTYYTINNVNRNVYVNSEVISHVVGITKGGNPATELHFDGSEDVFTVLHEPHEVANQLRRIAKRFDQDQELCCSPPPEPEEE